MKCVAAMSTASRISALLFGVAVVVFTVNRNIVNKFRKVRFMFMILLRLIWIDHSINNQHIVYYDLKSLT